MASVLLNYLHAGERIDSKTYPNLCEFLDRVFERKSFTDRIEDDLKTLDELSTLGRKSKQEDPSPGNGSVRSR